MALQYGMNITESDMRRLLEQNDRQQSGVRTWRQLFGNAALGHEAQTAGITSDYSDAIAQAYKSNLAQNSAILNSGISAGATKELLMQNRDALHSAYQTYVQNYGKDMTTATNAYLNEQAAIDTALNERSANFANLYNSAYKYLIDEVYGASRTTDGQTFNYMTEKGLDWMLNENQELLSDGELWRKMFNADDSLNAYGKMFFDAMLNATSASSLAGDYMTLKGDRMRGFDEWLSGQEDTFENYDKTTLPGMAKTGKELRDWWVTQDPFNYNFAGTNRGTANILTGRESTDSEYGAYEHLSSELHSVKPYDFESGFKSWRNAMTEYQHVFSDNWHQQEKWNKAVAKMEKEYEKWGSQAEQSIDYITAKNEYEAYKAKLNAAIEKLDKEWPALLTNLSKDYDKLLTDAKTTLGAEKYQKFVSLYGKELDEFKTYIDDIRTNHTPHGDARFLPEIENRYNKILAAINQFIKDDEASRKSSGF